jgi:hypothetical protein
MCCINSTQRTKLSPPEQILFNAVHELKPRTEAEWATVAAKWTHDIWREVINPCLPVR